MKLNQWIMALMCCLVSACGSSTTDEPEKPDIPNTPDTPTEEVRDWAVIYTESSHQNPKWNEVRNNSEECMSWKSLYRDYLIDHSSSGNNERWVWAFTHKSCTETEVETKVNQFIYFTRMPEPNATGLNGVDLFTAKVDYGEFWVDNSFNANASSEDNNKHGWIIEFTQNRFDAPGSTYVKPNGYDKWYMDNKDRLTHSSAKAPYYSYKWTFLLDDINDGFVKEQVIPFILWSKNQTGNPGESYDIFTVRTHQYGNPISKEYTSK